MSGSDSEASAGSQAPGGPVLVPGPPINVLYKLISGPAPGAQPAAATELWRKEMSAGFGDFVKKWKWEMREMDRVLADGVESIWGKPARLEPDIPASSGSPKGRWEWAPKIYSHGVESRKNRRPMQEDAVAVVAPLLVPAPAGEGGGDGNNNGGCGEGDQLEFFAVYDGHGGSRVSATCRERLHVALAEEMARLHLGKGGGGGEEEEAARWREAMAAAFARVDGEVGLVQVAEREKDPNSEHTEGSTAVVAVVGPRRIVVANCGDSRAVLCRGGAAVPLSTDHKPERPDERERIESVGGEIIYWQGARVQGVLATSRSIGDYFLKPSVTAEPEVTVMDRTVEDEFIILGSDGLWDAVSSEFACKLVRFCLSGRGAAKCPSVIVGSSTHDAARLLADFALWVGSPDNVSVVVVELTRLTYVKKKVVAKLNGSRPLPPARLT